MTITGAVVLFAVIWFLVFLVILPIGMKSQADAGHVEPGTPASAPSDAAVGRKAKLTTLITIGLWIVVAGIIMSGVISIRDIDFYHRMNPPAAGE
ncbi:MULTISPECIES: DUF1467 family protein [Haematobacter]|uniref:DUF1467 domain-containing protein n=1 Tax=Haematobacter genomosp. 1 TaxID=366618 RepID=A0A212A8D7_9RHOB|nr:MULTISPECIES: DUF1467 family protein [Haematobacter]OWJ76190.1 hypothetical protein CDV49_15395 [Haematobacter genomosp. 1]